ncbi:MAG TPA: HD domain-containing protein [Firmicutes bacterium]|nr:HD domain-containing protein [Bacillota bacterium]
MTSDFSKLKKGQRATVEALVTGVSERVDRYGNTYIDLTLTRGEESLSGKIWNSARWASHFPQVHKLLLGKKGLVVSTDGTVDEFNGNLQLCIDRVDILDKADYREYLPRSPYSREEMIKEFDEILLHINDEKTGRLLRAVFDEEVRELFFDAPAAKTYHHNYLSGLLEHTLFIARLGRKLLEVYPPYLINTDILMGGILVHDIGKIWEYENQMGSIDVTDEGKLKGHIIIGSEYVGRKAEEEGIDPSAALPLQHIILSHHGTREFGAAVLPMTMEAYLVHMLDNIDAKMKRYSELVKEFPDARWTGRQRMFNNVEIFLDQ